MKRNKKDNVYYEKHHIIPRCMGGDNKKNNIVKLTAKEHYVCHMLLCEIYPNTNKLKYAFWRMCNVVNNEFQDRNYTVSSNAYNRIKGEVSLLISANRKGKPTTLGYKHTVESIEKIKQSRAKQIITDKAKEKMSLSKKGKVSGRVGKTNSEKHRQRIKETLSKIKHHKSLSKKCSIDGIEFESAKAAADFYNINEYTMRDRLLKQPNGKFKNWVYIK